MARGYKNMSFHWNYSASTIIENLGFGRQLNKEVATIFRKYCEPYLPYDTGNLSRRTRITATKDHGTITYLSGYARPQYYGTGDYMQGENNPVDWQRNTAVHPFATSFWDRAAWTAHKREITQEVDNARLKYVKNRR